MISKDKLKKNTNQVLNFVLSRSIAFLISVLSIVFVGNSLQSIEIIKIDNPSSEFIERYEQNKGR